jgi:hypothetical protein
MGSFSAIRGATKEAKESAHGERLKTGLASTISRLDALDESVRMLALARFIESKKSLQQQMPDWPRERRIKVGRALQAEARKCLDLDQAKSYGLWLSGAWIESGERQSVAAEYVHLAVEELVKQVTE